jgi:hypothetical protein
MPEHEVSRQPRQHHCATRSRGGAIPDIRSSSTRALALPKRTTLSFVPRALEFALASAFSLLLTLRSWLGDCPYNAPPNQSPNVSVAIQRPASFATIARTLLIAKAFVGVFSTSQLLVAPLSNSPCLTFSPPKALGWLPPGATINEYRVIDKVANDAEWNHAPGARARGMSYGRLANKALPFTG